MTMRIFGAALVAVTTLAVTPVLAQTPPAAAPAAEAAPALSENDLQVLRSDLRSDKRKVMAEALALSDAEGVKFWPIYDNYVAELTKINDSKYALVKQYADRGGIVTDAQATDMAMRLADVDIKADQLRKKYIPIVGKVLPGIKAANFAQVDRRLAMLVNLGLSAQLPLAQSAPAK